MRFGLARRSDYGIRFSAGAGVDLPGPFCGNPLGHAIGSKSWRQAALYLHLARRPLRVSPVTSPPLEDLAASGWRANVFYEPWMLLPALEPFRARVALRFLFIYGKAGEPSRLWRFSSRVTADCRATMRLAAGHLGALEDKHCFSVTQLLRQGHARQCLAACSTGSPPTARHAFIDGDTSRETEPP